MDEESNITGLIYLIFDVLLFLFSVTAIVAIAKNGVVSNNIVMNEVLEKNNIRRRYWKNLTTAIWIMEN